MSNKPTLQQILDTLLKTVHPIIGDGQVEWPIAAENEAKQQLIQLIERERKAGRREGLEMAKQSVIHKEDVRHIEVLLHTQRAKELGVDLGETNETL